MKTQLDKLYAYIATLPVHRLAELEGTMKPATSAEHVEQKLLEIGSCVHWAVLRNAHGKRVTGRKGRSVSGYMRSLRKMIVDLRRLAPDPELQEILNSLDKIATEILELEALR